MRTVGQEPPGDRQAPPPLMHYPGVPQPIGQPGYGPVDASSQDTPPDKPSDPAEAVRQQQQQQFYPGQYPPPPGYAPGTYPAGPAGYQAGPPPPGYPGAPPPQYTPPPAQGVPAPGQPMPPATVLGIPLAAQVTSLPVWGVNDDERSSRYSFCAWACFILGIFMPFFWVISASLPLCLPGMAVRRAAVASCIALLTYLIFAIIFGAIWGRSRS